MVAVFDEAEVEFWRQVVNVNGERLSAYVIVDDMVTDEMMGSVVTNVFRVSGWEPVEEEEKPCS